MQSREYHCPHFTYEVQCHREVKCWSQRAREAAWRSSVLSRCPHVPTGSFPLMGTGQHEGLLGRRMWASVTALCANTLTERCELICVWYFFFSSPWDKVSPNSLISEFGARGFCCYRGKKQPVQNSPAGSCARNVLSAQVGFHCTSVHLPLSCAPVLRSQLHLTSLPLKPGVSNSKCWSSAEWDLPVTLSCMTNSPDYSGLFFRVIISFILLVLLLTPIIVSRYSDETFQSIYRNRCACSRVHHRAARSQRALPLPLFWHSQVFHQCTGWQNKLPWQAVSRAGSGQGIPTHRDARKH